MIRPVRQVLFPILAATLLAMLALVVPVRAFLGFSSGPEVLAPKDGQVSLPASGLADGKARFYAVTTGKAEIRFFVVQSPDGRIRAAFDACDVCFPEGKGYRQEGADMVCVNCGRHFHVSMVGDVRGGCNPAPLCLATGGGQVTIVLGDIEAGAAFFQPGPSGSPRS
jgi:uncharacterized membrane protein